MICPQCGGNNYICEYVDIGVGMQQCTPRGCEECHYVEGEPLITNENTKIIRSSSKEIRWIPFKDVAARITKLLSGDWSWANNSKCKYVEIRIDMRTGQCLIKDRDGEMITMDELEYQI